MSEIEEVARAIHAASEEVYTIEASRLLARAAIEAMREPTDAMRLAGSRAGPYDDDGDYTMGEDAVEDIFTAMIDAALSEQPQ